MRGRPPAVAAGGSGPGDLERTLPLLRAGHAVYVQGVVGNLNLPMCFATECRSIERALVNLFRFRSADRTCPRHCVSLMGTQRTRGGGGTGTGKPPQQLTPPLAEASNPRGASAVSRPCL